ncbi:MAG: mannose-1-phosphate guanylyltransferase/mannose-6-phosphate isomerase [Nitrospinota bacterium]|nr:mannose-1-phosphate guanylyltransferase/mannose-6-phosphate isomerase [Nitrospinota bacterium]
MIGVILSGGSGTRFWPQSRELYPKQFLRIAGSRTMIQDTVARITPLISIERIFVVTNERHAVETCKQLADFDFKPAHVLAEPEAKNTAPALGFAARVLAANYAEEVMAVFPADHIVKDPDAFHKVLQTAENLAKKNYLVTLAIKPTRPETGYGYIKKGLPIDNDSFKVQEFVEKPNLEKAQAFLDQGNYFWNCGVFLWKVSTLLEEMKKHMPDSFKKLEPIDSFTELTIGKFSYRSLNSQGREIYKNLSSISVDYAILEKSQNVAVIPTQMPWSDVGSWSALEEISPPDQDGNLLAKDVVAVDCSGSIIQGDDRLIAVVGTKDLVVVDTPDALLVCDKKRSQDVKKIVEKIKSIGRPEAHAHVKRCEPWGTATVLEKSQTHVITKLEVLPGEEYAGEIQFNKTWVVVEGQAEVLHGDETDILEKNQSTFIPKATKHYAANPGDSLLIILEMKTT